MSMSKRFWLSAAALLGGVAFASAALAQAPPATTGPGAGLAGTEHDFTRFNGAGNTVDVGLCTFCHTPHRAYQTRLAWNHTLSSNTFSWTDVTTTVNGTPLPTFDANWQGVSKNCLSCHDGTVALGDVAWFDAAPRTGVDAILDHTHDAVDDAGLITFSSPGTGEMNGNHPIAHPYPFQGAVSSYNGVTSDVEVLDSGWVADPTTNGIRLFNDDGAGNVSAGPVSGFSGIECSSCHDPHNGSLVEDEHFLRGTLTGSDASYICLKCHQK
jgi:hypothetical protein